MRKAYTVEQVRAAEAAALATLPPGALMQRAAGGLAAAIADFVGHVYGARVLLLVGSGDNGGDALFAGAMLARRGAWVEALLLSDRAHPEGLATLRAAGGRVRAAPAETYPRSSGPDDRGYVSVGGRRPDVVVDGIVGIGGRGGLRPDAARVVAALGEVPVVAVDVPSGVDVDTGALPESHVRAALTVTFGCLKVAHLADPAAAACGAVELVDLGLELELDQAPVAALRREDVIGLARVDEQAHKYTRGVVGLDTGSADFPGAAVLGVAAALSGTAGMVRYAGPARDAVAAAHPEVVPGRGRVQAWVVGSGGGEGAARALDQALGDDVPVVVDADALAHVGTGRRQHALVLTPHAGELARMLDEERTTIEAEPLAWARSAARAYDAVVLLKGRRAVIAAPDGRVRINTTGTPWLATAGSGDVLAGLVGSLVAAGIEPFEAAAAGAWVHGAAAALIDGPLRSGELPDAVTRVLRGLGESRSDAR